MMQGKTIIVTGANAGIGKITSLKLAEMGAEVIMVCRNRIRGEETFLEIREKTGNENLHIMICDFSQPDSIAKFVRDFKQKYKKLDVLINNHGVTLVRKHLTKEGIESTFAINHLGYFSLTLQLLDKLKPSDYARIINVASSANYRVKELNIEDYNWEKRRYSFMNAYAESKLYNIMFTLFLAEKLKDTHVTVNCLHPGFIKTGLGINHAFLKPLNPIVKIKARPVEEGADTTILLATDPELEGVTGKYYHKMVEKEPNNLAYDKEAQEKLWNLSLELTNLKFYV